MASARRTRGGSLKKALTSLLLISTAPPEMRLPKRCSSAAAPPARGGRARASPAWARRTDVRSFSDVEALMQETVKRFGRIDILLNNAAIYVTQKLWKGPVEELAIDEWDRVIEVNLKGVFLCSKAVIPIMKQQKSG